MVDPRDNLLVHKTLKGDAESFRLLVDRYKNALFSASYRLIRNKDDAEDLVQEAFIKAYEHLAGFDQKRSFFTWLYTICINLTINKLKKRDYSLDEGNCLDQNANANPFSHQTFANEQTPEGRTLCRCKYRLCSGPFRHNSQNRERWYGLESPDQRHQQQS